MSQPLAPIFNALGSVLRKVTRGPFAGPPVEVPNQSFHEMSDCDLYCSALAALEAHTTPSQIRHQFSAVNRVDRFWYVDNAWKYARNPHNWNKNRYVNILPFDHNRVRLKTEHSRDNYINASPMVDPLLAGIAPDIEPAIPTNQDGVEFSTASMDGAEADEPVEQKPTQPVERLPGTTQTEGEDEGGAQIFRGMDHVTAKTATDAAQHPNRPPSPARSTSSNGGDSDTENGQEMRKWWEPAAEAAKAAEGGWAYIATQGATRSTIPDFWRMVVEQNVSAVVMLCNVVEEGKPKCAQYYPLEAGEKMQAGPYEVTTLDTSQLDRDTDLRKMSVRNTQNPKEATWQLEHFHYHAWPDQGVPTGSRNTLWRMAEELDRARRPGCNIVVHCSAGIGRTGTFLAMDIMRQRLLRLPELVRGPSMSAVDGAAASFVGKALDIGGLVAGLRKQRMGMVQTSGQFNFICSTVLDHLKDMKEKCCGGGK